MKIKQIENRLQKKFNDWVESVDDFNLRSRIRQGSIITGGAICSMLTDDYVRDYDIYFKTPELAQLVAEYYLKKAGVGKVFNPATNPHLLDHEINNLKLEAGLNSEDESNNEEVETAIAQLENLKAQAQNRVFILIRGSGFYGTIKDEDDSCYDTVCSGSVQTLPKPYQVKFITSNAITLNSDIQLIMRFSGEPKEIHDNYDFVHCTNYWTSWENKVTTNKEALEAILAKELRYVGSRYPLCSLFRVRKFTERGWHVNAGQLLKIAAQINDLDLYNVRTLEEQLIGVDTTHFRWLITELRNKDYTSLDSSSFIDLINKVF